MNNLSDAENQFWVTQNLKVNAERPTLTIRYLKSVDCLSDLKAWIWSITNRLQLSYKNRIKTTTHWQIRGQQNLVRHDLGKSGLPKNALSMPVNPLWLRITFNLQQIWTWFKFHIKYLITDYKYKLSKHKNHQRSQRYKT